MGSKSIGSASFFIKAYAVIQLLFALTLFGGGAYLIILNGSWYYCITGLLLIISSIYLYLNKIIGAKIFGIVFVYTLIWTIWESGTRFWGWIPRIATIAVFAFFYLYSCHILRMVYEKELLIVLPA